MELKKTSPSNIFKRWTKSYKTRCNQRPKVTPKIYNDINKKINGKPILKIEMPKGIARIAAGTSPINVLNIAVKVKDAIISFNLIGAINKFVKLRLQISSKNIIL